MPKPAQTSVSPEKVIVPFPRVTGLVRQLTHDVRNGLNNVDLQAALLQELVTDPQVTPEVKRLRGMISDAAKMLQTLSSTFWLQEPHFVTYSAKMFVEDFQARLEKLLPQLAPHLRWTVHLKEEMIPVDIEMIFRGLSEFFKNAWHFREGERPIEVHIGAEKQMLVVKIVEPKSSLPGEPETWGVEPLVTTRRGGFGMGLFYARQVIGVHGGEIAFTFDRAGGKLTTRLALPLAPR